MNNITLHTYWPLEEELQTHLACGRNHSEMSPMLFSSLLLLQGRFLQDCEHESRPSLSAAQPPPKDCFDLTVTLTPPLFPWPCVWLLHSLPGQYCSAVTLYIKARRRRTAAEEVPELRHRTEGLQAKRSTSTPYPCSHLPPFTLWSVLMSSSSSVSSSIHNISTNSSSRSQGGKLPATIQDRMFLTWPALDPSLPRP